MVVSNLGVCPFFWLTERSRWHTSRELNTTRESSSSTHNHAEIRAKSMEEGWTVRVITATQLFTLWWNEISLSFAAAASPVCRKKWARREREVWRISLHTVIIFVNVYQMELNYLETHSWEDLACLLRVSNFNRFLGFAPDINVANLNHKKFTRKFCRCSKKKLLDWMEIKLGIFNIY